MEGALNTCASQAIVAEQVGAVLKCTEKRLLRADGGAGVALCGAAAMWLTLHCTLS